MCDPNIGEKILIETSKEAAKQLAKPLYDDLIHPPAKESGNIIKNFIHGIGEYSHRFALRQDFKTRQLEQDLILELKDISPDRLTLPEDYIFIPALLAYSHSIDCNELRKLYARLLARSMINDEQQTVHPSFIEIIKQLSPTDCRVFNEIMSQCDEIPVIHFFKSLNPHQKSDVVPIIKNVTVLHSDSTEQLCFSIDNLSRLMLIQISDAYITDSSFYEPIYQTELCKSLENEYQTKLVAEFGSITKTEFGKLFFKVCVSPID